VSAYPRGHPATLVIATIRGLLLDLLATGEQDRVQDAAEAFLASLYESAAVRPLNNGSMSAAA
jgi:hypothetical protein